MSPGDQLITVFIDSIGVLIGALINLFLTTFIQPILDSFIAGLGGG